MLCFIIPGFNLWIGSRTCEVLYSFQINFLGWKINTLVSPTLFSSPETKRVKQKALGHKMKQPSWSVWYNCQHSVDLWSYIWNIVLVAAKCKCIVSLYGLRLDYQTSWRMLIKLRHLLSIASFPHGQPPS